MYIQGLVVLDIVENKRFYFIFEWSRA